MLSELTPDQRKLAEAMSEISEEAYYSGWQSRLEFALWHLLISGRAKYGRATLTTESIENLRTLSQKCGGWIVFDDHSEECFISMTNWERKFAAEFTPADERAQQERL
ncbi:MAG: hypothetical protein SFY80_02510 [Verrucomicrobiota bacterium]|nr:hypothetical protein [Verrucomicrobiota bacterium]